MPESHTQGQEPVGQGQGLILKAKTKDSKFVLEDTSRQDNNTDFLTLVPLFFFINVAFGLAWQTKLAIK